MAFGSEPPRLLTRLPATLACVACAIALGACGSTTKTVTVSSAPPASSGKATTKPQTTSSPTTTSTTPGTSSSAPTTTRSAPEPAFSEKESRAAGGVNAAAELVRAKGYTPNNVSEFHSNQALQVLVGTHTGSGDGYGQQAFFFINGHYIGTDAKAPSATLRVVSQGDTEVTLAYPLYRKHDPLCCPGGGTADVRFQLNNGKLMALDPIPPASRSAGVSRY